jgi:hypothetical protein
MPSTTHGSPACRSRNSSRERTAPIYRPALHGHPISRAGDDGCSAKNTTVAALTTTTPVRETIMAPTIVIPIASDAKAADTRGHAR